MANQKNIETAKNIFDKDKDCKEVHFASDGQAFYQKSNAINQARVLASKEIETIKRGDVTADVESEKQQEIVVPPAPKDEDE
jgi:hypothetical protein